MTNTTITIPKRIQAYGSSVVIRVSEECKMLGLNENDLVDISIQSPNAKTPLCAVKAVQHYGPSKVIRVTDMCSDEMNVGMLVNVTFRKHSNANAVME